MADTKISALPASTTPLAGTEVLPIVQSSTTRQVSVANLTAGRAISATQLTLTTGNLIVASGQGIDFSATSHPAGMTSELLADYEEGTWTPAIIFSSSGDLAITYSTQTGTYTKVGRQVTVTFSVATSSFTHSTASGVLIITGLPFNAGSSSPHTATTSFVQGITKANYTSFGFYSNSGSGNLTSAACGSGQGFDNITAANVPSGGSPLITCTLTYFV